MPSRADRREAAARWRKAAARPSRKKARSVQKSLLVLWLLARASAEGDRVVPFDEVEAGLTRLLDRYGPPHGHRSPAEGFWHLQTDRIWLVPGAGNLRPKRSDPLPTAAVLRREGAVGEVPKRLWAVAVEEPELRAEVAGRLLSENWPLTLHEAIRREVGLGVGVPGRGAPDADAAFGETVLEAYEQRCAVCGYDGRLGDESLGVGVAYVRWPCLGGPHVTDNALALCALHHDAFDRGALSIDLSHRVTVSAAVRGGDAVRDWLVRFHGADLRRPQPDHASPAEVHLAWHRAEVFRAPARSTD